VTAGQIQTQPTEGGRWLNGESVDGWNSQWDREHYKQNQQKPMKATHLTNEEEAVLQWSGIPQLRAALTTVLAANRLEQEMREAEARCDNAFAQM
jgi:hypothetical protein